MGEIEMKIRENANYTHQLDRNMEIVIMVWECNVKGGDRHNKKHSALRGFAKNFFQKIRDYYGSGWVGPGLTLIFFGKSP